MDLLGQSGISQSGAYDLLGVRIRRVPGPKCKFVHGTACKVTCQEARTLAHVTRKLAHAQKYLCVCVCVFDAQILLKSPDLASPAA
jgi:hypothetical protein